MPYYKCSTTMTKYTQPLAPEIRRKLYNMVSNRERLTNSTNEYCLTSTLEQVQNSTGTDVTPSFFLNLLTGSGDSISQLSSSFSNGEFCTGCVAT